MKIRGLIWSVLSLCNAVFAQGFVNLDFESAAVDGFTQGSLVPIANAIPGWVGYSINPGSTIQLNNQIVFELPAPRILSDDLIALQTTNTGSIAPGLMVVDGRYSILLESGFVSPPSTHLDAGGNNAAIGQTGLIPLDSKTLLFSGYFTGQITFSGQIIPYSVKGTLAENNNNNFVANISSFAGQIGELLFSTTPSSPIVTLDNIQFSPQPIPEPNSTALLTIGAILFTFSARQRSARQLPRR